MEQSKRTVYREIKEWTIVILAIFAIRTLFFSNYQVPSGSMETTMLVGERFFADKLTPYFLPIQHGEIIAFNDPNYPYATNRFMNWFERYVWGPSNITKRVIGIPGDHIKGVIEADAAGKQVAVIYLNDKKLDEPYLNKYPLIPIMAGNNVLFQSWDQAKPYDQQPFYSMDEAVIKKTTRYLERVGRPAILYPGTPLDGNADVFDVHLGNNEYWVMGDNRLNSSDSRSWGVLPAHLIHGRIRFRYFSIDNSDSWLIFDLLLHPISFWERVRWSRCMQRVM